MNQQIIKDITNKKISPVYLLFGTEYFFINQIKNAFEGVLGQEEEIITYDLRETSIQDVITDVETFPFFSEQKVIFAYYPVFLQSSPEKVNIVHDLEVLETYLKEPVDYSTLVLIAPYEKMDARKKITKLLKKNAKVVECQPIKGKELQTFISEIARREGIILPPEIYTMLENAFQTDLFFLQKELNKLALYAREDKQISKEDAEKLISPTNQSNALKFVDAVLKRDLKQAIVIYKDLEKMKEEPIGLIALLAYQFRIVFQVKILQKKGYPLDKIKSELKVHPYVVQLASERSRYFTEATLTTIIHSLMETDELIKRGKMEKNIAFEMLLYKLVSQT